MNYVHELLRNHKVSDATFKAMTDRFGEKDTLHLHRPLRPLPAGGAGADGLRRGAGRRHEQRDTGLGTKKHRGRL